MSDLKRVYRDLGQDARHVAAVEAVVQQGDLPRAVAMARAELDAGLIHPLLLNLRSYWHGQAGRPADALSDLRIALEMAPNDLFVRNALGLLLVKTGDTVEARRLMQGTVSLAPGFAPAQYCLGWLHAFSGEPDAAMRCFEAAIAVNPDMPEALGHLAILYARHADWAAAERLAARALNINSGQPAAVMALVMAAIAQGNLTGAEVLLAQLGDLAQLPLFEASLARTLLGDLRNAQGRYREAFQEYADRNAEKVRATAAQYQGAGRRTGTAYALWLKDHFSQSQGTGQPTTEPDNDAAMPRAHVFLVGFPRSGTTLAESVLASHPDICTLEEQDTLGAAAEAFLADDAGLENLLTATPQQLEEHRAIYWQRVREAGAEPSNRVFIDKYPLASLRLPLVARLFPRARILFAVRDPRDVLLSCFRRDFALNPAMFELLDLETGARFYNAVMELCEVYRTTLGLAWRQLRYEALVEDFEGEMRKVCDFVGVEWHKRMHDFASLSRNRTIRTPSAIQVSRGLYGEGRGQWQNYAEDLAPVMPMLAPWITAFGYDSAR